MNEYDQFEYDKTPDYLPRMKEIHKEQNEALARAEQMHKINDAQRLDNAKQFDKTINNVAKFSKTLGTILEERRDKKDREYANESAQISHDTGITRHGMKTAISEGEYLDEVSYLNGKAAEFEAEGKHDLAEQLRNLHGHKLVIFKETLAKKAAINLSTNWDAEKDTFKTDDGVGWNDEDITQEKRGEIFRQWMVKRGLTDVSSLSPEFLEKNFWPTVERNKSVIMSQSQEQLKVIKKNERIASIKDQMLTAAETQPPTLGPKLIELIKVHGIELGGKSEARKQLINQLDDMLANDLISEQAYRELLQYEFKADDGSKQTIGKYWEKDFGNIEDRINAAKAKGAERLNDKNKALTLDFIKRVENAISVNDGIFTENDVAFFEKEWKQNPETAHLPVPDILNRMGANTVEDRDDNDYVAEMKENVRQGRPVGNAWVRIQDPTLREEWRKISASASGQGMTDEIKTDRDTMLGRWTDEYLQETVVGNKSSSLQGNILRRAKASYAMHYANAEGKFEDEPPGNAMKQRHEYAKSLVKVEIETGLHTQDPPLPDTKSHAFKLKGAINDIKKGKENNQDIIRTQIIAGTETEFKRLEKDPTKVPAIYFQIAKKAKTRGTNGALLTGWDIANYQYKSQTGKELPKPGEIAGLQEKSPVQQNYLLHKPTYNRKVRARELDSKDSQPDYTPYITPGLSPGLDNTIVS